MVRIASNDAIGSATSFLGVGKPDLSVARLGAELRLGEFTFLSARQWHRYEEHVPQASLDRAPARNQVIRDRISKRAKPQLVAGLTLLKERHDPLRALSLGFVEIDPGKR